MFSRGDQITRDDVKRVMDRRGSLNSADPWLVGGAGGNNSGMDIIITRMTTSISSEAK